LGDARATQMGERGELNLGQLVRERFGNEAVSIGFTTYDGTVTAASDWDGPAERKNVRPGHPESYEALFHEVAALASGGRLFPGGRATPNDMATRSSWATQPVHRTGCPSGAERVDIPNFFLNLRDLDVAAALRNERLERAIGVIYRPDTELISHYFHARLPDQFDAILHYDHTRAVEPLERTAEWEAGEVEETFPSGL
jgi:erythromycin esterase-like protein